MILAIIFFTRKHKKFDGQLTATYFLGYGIGRFIIESMRTDQLKIFGVPVSMLLSAVLATVSLVFIGYKLIGLKQNRE
jgi:phosphatidylglycerol:prolipoprotein diacylglycerol transferase